MGIADVVAVIVGAISVATAIVKAAMWAGTTYLKPMADNIQLLTQGVNDLKDSISKQLERMHLIEVKVQDVEDRCKSNQHRIDELEEEMKELRHELGR
jgi:peptidoglycan hydrolase CwlO-like protein